MRLDSILVSRGVLNSDQVCEALDYQRHHGGRLETHLYRLGYVGEKELVAALSDQFGVEAMEVSDLNVTREVLDMIPSSLARNHLVLPVGFNREENTLRVACENPVSSGLTEALKLALPDTNVELYVALGIELKCAILKFYRESMVLFSDPDKAAGHSEVTVLNSESREVPKQTAKAGQSPDLILACRILILNEARADLLPLRTRLKAHDFESMAVSSQNEFHDLYLQSEPEILVIVKSGSLEEISETIFELTERGIFVDHTPTYLLSESLAASELAETLGIGIEDAYNLDEGFDALLIKMDRVRARFEAEASRQLTAIQELGTWGSLEDINMIDLLQTLGPSRKTARLSITGHGRHLELYLNNGNIIYAECDGKTGPDAVYQGIAWTRGIWNIDPVTNDELPEPNNDLPNESILLEGCRLQDEMSRAECPQ